MNGAEDIGFRLFSRILTHALYENESLRWNECCEFIEENQIRTGRSTSSESFIDILFAGSEIFIL